MYLKHIAKTDPGKDFVEVDRTEGIYVVDVEGKKYFDLASGIGPSILGHHHPRIQEAIDSQSRRYLHTMVYGMHIQSPQVELATAILNELPDHFEQVYFLSSGSEAVEAAVKIGKLFTGRKKVIAAANAYHGSTVGAESLRSDADFTKNLAPLVPGIDHIRFNHMSDLGKIDSETGCVIMETVQAEAGIVVPDQEYMKALRAKCDEVGAVLIFDEIQMGMGRTGHLFAFEGFNIRPDILVMGKAIGGGLPLSAVVSSKDMMQSISHAYPLAHLTTFGGHPLCCATGKAAWDVIQENKLWLRAQEIGSRYTDLLSPHFELWRQYGAMFGIGCGTQEKAGEFQTKLLENGIISDMLLFKSDMIRMAPPLVITDQEIEESAKAIVSAARESIL